MTSPLVQIAEKIAASAPYTGGPVKSFEAVGRDTFITLLENGLRPDHKLLDFGCGALRLGYWLVRFLDAGNYYGIEPDQKMINAGLEHALPKQLLEDKKPIFHDSRRCEIGVFGVHFDFGVARSIFTHMTPAPVRKTLKEFADNANPGAVFMASYWPLDGDLPTGEYLNGDEMPPHQWEFRRVVKYSFPRMRKFASGAGLRIREYERKPIHGQAWLRFTKPV